MDASHLLRHHLMCGLVGTKTSSVSKKLVWVVGAPQLKLPCTLLKSQPSLNRHPSVDRRAQVTAQVFLASQQPHSCHLSCSSGCQCCRHMKVENTFSGYHSTGAC